MRVALVGADLEENLGIGMIAAAATQAGHEVVVVPFNGHDELGAVAARVIQARPDVVGLAVQFQHRAHEFLDLSRRLRASGFAGHVAVGGQFPTMAWREVLAGGHGVDSVVLHEGEQTLVDLLDALERGESHGRVGEVAGLAIVGDDGAPVRTAPRPLVEDLDELPFPRRYRPHARHEGVPFIPILGSRGCWGSCAFCSISTFYRDARRQAGGGCALRLRSPESVAIEMALLWHAAGGPSIFCFHDDNFLLKRPEDSLARLRELRARLDELGVGRVGLVGKCRPETLTPELARELAALGVIRLYVGIENVSRAGAAHLRRRHQQPAVRSALEACRRAGIFVCYNLLVFEPWATLDDVRENVRFIREQPMHPVNFCRAEPYHGTPLHRRASAEQQLGGSYLGWNYRIADDRTELLFRICSAAFHGRNFAADGVANRSMGVGYAAKVVEHFHVQPGGYDSRFELLRRRADALTCELTAETAGFLERAIELAANASMDRGPGADLVERETALLGLEIARADRVWQRRMDDYYADLNALVATLAKPAPRPVPTQKLLAIARGLTLGLSLTLGAAATSCSCFAVDPAPRDSGTDADLDADRDTQFPDVVDPLPQDSGVDADRDQVVDPLPPDSGLDADPDFPDAVDPVPPDSGVDADEDDAQVADPLPEDAGIDADQDSRPHDPPPMDSPRVSLEPRGLWRDTGARRAPRSSDLPLSAPPEVSLQLSDDTTEGSVRARLVGGPDALTIRWEAEGELTGSGREVRWVPADGDQLIAAVRSAGGVTVVAARRG